MTTETSSNKNPDADILKGGPMGNHGEEMPKDGQSHPDITKDAKEKTKYELNGKTFDSIEDMSKYVADLERKVIEPQTPIVQTQVQNQTQKVLIDGMTLDQLMFANPERYHEYIIDQADKRADAKIAQVEHRKTFWQDFYNANPDLRGKEEIVDALVAKNWTTWEKMPVKDFSKVVSDTSRSTLRKVGAFNATEVKQGEAATLSASGEKTAPVERPRQETSFVDEIRNRQIRRIKAKIN